MRIYICAPWKDKLLMPDIAAQFEAAGHTITHKWWETEDIPEGDRTIEILREQARLDKWGVWEAGTLVLLNTAKSEGKAVEQGMALAWGIPIIAVGKRGDGTSLNVFHYAPSYTWVDTVEEVLCLLT